MSIRSIRACIVVSLIGCGGTQPAKAPTPVSVEAAPQMAEEPPDLSPVARPSNVFMTARLARPRLFVETLSQWAARAQPLERALPPEVQGLAQAVKWEAPIDFVMALDPFGEGKLPRPLMAGSIGLKSLQQGLDAAEARQLATRRLAPGVFRIGELEDVSCAIAASAGSASARLVCGQTSKDVDALLPYVTRGLPNEPEAGPDFELVLTAVPLQQRYANQVGALRLLAGVGMREVALDSARFDRALSDLIYGAVDETINLFNDLDQVRMEARLDTARRALLWSAELRLKADSSWTAGTIAAAKAQPVPASLPRLPPETSFACYAPVLPAERYAALSRILGDLVEGYLEHEKLPPAARQRARRALSPWFDKLPESFSFVVRRTDAAAQSNQETDTSVTRVSEPAPRILALYGDLLALLSDPAFKRWAKQKLAVDDKAWPKSVKKPLKLAGFKAPASHFELAIDWDAWTALDSPIAKALRSALPTTSTEQLGRVNIVVQPDGEFTYVIVGSDTREIARVMAEHKKNEPGVIFAKPARADKVTAAGFVTLGYLARTLERRGKPTGLSGAIAATSQHGLTPLPFSATTAPGVARVDLEIPEAVIGDINGLAARGDELWRLGMTAAPNIQSMPAESKPKP